MKKIVTLLLALAMILTSVAAIAESHGIPNISNFATMKTKYDERNHVISITLDKPVARLLVNWAEKGAEPEEVLVGEDLKAQVLTWNHKYMPGTTQYYATWSADGGYTLESEELIATDPVTNKRIYKQSTTYDYTDKTIWAPVWEIKAYRPIRTLNGKTDEEVARQIADYKAEHPSNSYEISYPEVIEDGTRIPGIIQGLSIVTEINGDFPTVIANPAQIAYMTVQDGWAVYYNRAGKIVGIDYFEGQF